MRLVAAIYARGKRAVIARLVGGTDNYLPRIPRAGQKTIGDGVLLRRSLLSSLLALKWCIAVIKPLSTRVFL